MRRWLRSASFLLVVLMVTGCTSDDDRGWIDLTVDGIDYRLSWVSLMIVQLPDGQAFLGLGQEPGRVNIVTAVPGGGLQWKMPLGETSELQGRTIDLSHPDRDGIAIFDLTDDFGLVNLDGSPQVRVRFDRVQDGYAEGWFEGENFHRMDADGEDLGQGPFQGRFRARIDDDSPSPP